MTCANCGQSISAPENSVGRVGKCPKCKAQIALVAATPQSSVTGGSVPSFKALALRQAARLKEFLKKNVASVIALAALGLLPVFALTAWYLLRTAPKVPAPQPENPATRVQAPVAPAAKPTKEPSPLVPQGQDAGAKQPPSLAPVSPGKQLQEEDERRVAKLPARVKAYLERIARDEGTDSFVFPGLGIVKADFAVRGTMAGKAALRIDGYSYSADKRAAKVTISVQDARLPNTIVGDAVWAYSQNRGEWFVFGGPWNLAQAIVAMPAKPLSEKGSKCLDDLGDDVIRVHAAIDAGYQVADLMLKKGRESTSLSAQATDDSSMLGTAMSTIHLQYAQAYLDRSKEVAEAVVSMGKYYDLLADAITRCKAGATDIQVAIPAPLDSMERLVNKPIKVKCPVCATCGPSLTCKSCQGRGELTITVNIKFPQHNQDIGSRRGGEE